MGKSAKLILILQKLITNITIVLPPRKPIFWVLNVSSVVLVTKYIKIQARMLICSSLKGKKILPTSIYVQQKHCTMSSIFYQR